MTPLALRIVTGIVLIVVAIAAVRVGGTAFLALTTLAVLLMFAEWSVMHGVGRGLRLGGLTVLAAVCGLAVYGPALDAVILLAAGAALLGLFARGMDRPRAFWVASGLLYCGLPGIALLWLRGLPLGLELTAGVLALVWTADIVAFFAGRAIGGPKLAPTISPGKTWAGAIAALIAVAVAAPLLGEAIFSATAVSGRRVYFVLIGVGLAGVAILGDLFESWLKRRAGVKDSGTLLPGHGGVMDRLDALVPVSVVAALFVAVAR